MFPFEIDEEEVIDETPEDIEEEEPCEYGVDFKTGKLTGGKVRGKKAVMVWAWNALKTYRFVYEPMSWDYGSSLPDLIGKAMSPGELEARAEALVREALTANPYIEGISEFSCEVDGDKMTVSFKLETSFGEEDMNVEIRG